MKSRQRWYRRHQLFNQSIEPALKPWLFDVSSLTARLVQLCGEQFSVRLLSQSWQRPEREEVSEMALMHENAALIREVLLCCDKQPLVYARTVLPASTVSGSLRRYANLGNRPLGAMLFADRTMCREPVQVAVLPDGHKINQYTSYDESVWGRRSVFRVAGKPLLVSEYFLPELLRQL